MTGMRSRRRLARMKISAVLCALVLAASGSALAQAAPDAFYLALLRDGKSEMRRGDAVAAKKSFRLASFGFLEQPVLLAEGLVRLGLAEAALNDREAFVATFSRLAEVEEHFAAYLPAALSADERQAFEAKALEWVTPEVLHALPSFAPLLARKTEIDFAKLSPRDRIRELEKRSAAEPANPHWKVLLAEDEAAGDHSAKVLARLEGVPDGAENGSVGCLRGRASARLKRCEEAVVAFGACATVTSDALLAEAQLTCLVSLDRSENARAFAARLANPVADAPAVRKAIARIPAADRPAKEEPTATSKPAKPAPPPTPAATAPTKKPAGGKQDPVKESTPVSPVPPAASTTPPPPPRPAPSAAKPAGDSAKVEKVEKSEKSGSAASAPAQKMTAEEERLVAEARGLLKSVENRDELRRGFTLLQPVADRLPGRTDLQLLTGEIAYRAGLWTAGVEYFERSTPAGRSARTGPVDPTQRFYYAVCLYESGDFAGAANAASSGLEKLPSLPFVESYLQKIRAARP